MKIRMADLTISIHNRYPDIEEYCSDYIVDEEETEDFTASVSQEEILLEDRKVSPSWPGEAELACIYRFIGYRLTQYSGLIMHAVIMEVNGTGIAILADSGTGKTTLARNILSAYQGKARIINGDKPILRLIDHHLMAYGTPWNGKERYGCNDSVELKKLCFIRRGPRNSIEGADAEKTMELLFPQLLIPVDEESVYVFCDLVDRILDVTESYIAACTEDRMAAVTVIEGMNIC